MGLRLRELREKRGLTPRQMTERLGVKEDRYRKWENGVNGMPLEYALEACSILRCSLDELSGRVIPALADDERRLLGYYNDTDDRGRAVIMAVARSQAEPNGALMDVSWHAQA